MPAEAALQASMEQQHSMRHINIKVPVLAAGLTHLDFSSLGDRRDEFISNAGIGALSMLTELKSLNLAGHVQLTPEGLNWLSECTGLTALDLSGGRASWQFLLVRGSSKSSSTCNIPAAAAAGACMQGWHIAAA